MLKKGPKKGMSVSNENESWISVLPEALHKIPLTDLAIPGSHDSFTFNMNKKNEICITTLPSILRRFSNWSFLHRIIYNWSVTQSLTVTQQLNLGIRYFDLRLAEKSDCKSPLYVHGLYCDAIHTYLEEVHQFLLSHTKEVVILDFNHFYDMKPEDHCFLVEKVFQIFSSMVCPVMKTEELTLDFMWNKAYQVIIIYQCETDPPHKLLWPGSSIRSMWPDTMSCDELFKKLDNEWFRERDNPFTFKVYQGVLTPTTTSILFRITSDLKRALISKNVFSKFTEWIHNRKIDFASGDTLPRNQVNVFIADFIELEGFVDAVIELNFRSLVKSDEIATKI